jgi:hypothetical protein
MDLSRGLGDVYKRQQQPTLVKFALLSGKKALRL